MLGERLCEQYGFQLVDASVIEKLAHKAKVSPAWLSAMEKEASNTLLSIISKVVSSGFFYKHPGPPIERDDRQKYIAFLTKIFTAMANEGGYVIVGRGAQFILKDHPKVIHVLLVSDYESRIMFLVDHYNISRSEAANKIRVEEKERAAVATRLFEADIDDLDLYHVVLNVSLMPHEWAEKTIFQVVNRYIDQDSGP